MCTLVYLGAEVPITGSAWSDGAPAFHVRQLEISEWWIREMIPTPFIAYVGSREKCGCTFSYGQFEGDDDAPEQLRAKHEDILSLRSLIEEIQNSTQASLTLLVMEADEPFKNVGRRQIVSSELHDGFFFLPPEIVTVRNAA